MTLTALEFVRRLLLHVLPTGFMRLRHYGILANRHRHEKLALCRHRRKQSISGCRKPPKNTRRERETGPEAIPEALGGKHPPLASRRGHSNTKEARPCEAAQFNRVVSEGPTRLAESRSVCRPSRYNILHYPNQGRLSHLMLLG